MRRWWIALLVVLVCIAVPIQFATAQDERCFRETGHCITGRVREFWETNGGLATFGFPIGPARNELNRDTGQTYLTQWFERNRFELHPENAAPYDVLLGRLSVDRMGQLAHPIAAREPGAGLNCLWFPTTGHNVCDFDTSGGFRTYWQSGGLSDSRLDAYGRSLALWGLPLTAPRMETNGSGDTVLTQWFERARFEWHASKTGSTPQVLLGLLGNEVRNASPDRATSPTTPPTRSTATPRPSLTPAPLTATSKTATTPTPTQKLATPIPSPTMTRPPMSTAATSTVAPASTTTGDDALKHQLLVLVDSLHQAAGCAQHVRDPRVFAAAQGHAADIATHMRIDHLGTDGSTVQQRLQRAGYAALRASESIAVYQTPEQVVAMWMDEPPDGPHRRNITSCQYTDIGVGLAYDQRGKRWWVMDIATAR